MHRPGKTYGFNGYFAFASSHLNGRMSGTTLTSLVNFQGFLNPLSNMSSTKKAVNPARTARQRPGDRSRRPVACRCHPRRPGAAARSRTGGRGAGGEPAATRIPPRCVRAPIRHGAERPPTSSSAASAAQSPSTGRAAGPTARDRAHGSADGRLSSSSVSPRPTMIEMSVIECDVTSIVGRLTQA